MTVMTATRVVHGRQADLLDRQAERRAENRHRRTRVEVLGLPYCDVCGGCSAGTDPKRLAEVKDAAELFCVCAVRAAELEARLRRIVHTRTGVVDDPRDRIAQ